MNGIRLTGYGGYSAWLFDSAFGRRVSERRMRHDLHGIQSPRTSGLYVEGTARMAVVEDYVPDSDDEDVPTAEEVISIPEEPARPRSAEETKGSSTDLVERLRVPPVFADVIKAPEIRESYVPTRCSS